MAPIYYNHLSILSVFGAAFGLRTNFTKCSITPIRCSAEDLELSSVTLARFLTFLAPTSAFRCPFASCQRRPCSHLWIKSPIDYSTPALEGTTYHPGGPFCAGPVGSLLHSGPCFYGNRPSSMGYQGH